MYTIPKYRTTLVREGQLSYARKFVNSAESASAVAKSMLALEPVECILTMYLTGSGALVGVEQVARGSMDRCACTPADIFRGALIAGASSVVVAHNHPSGSVEASAEDVSVTQALIEAGRILGVPVLDHLIVGRDIGSGVHVSSLRDTCDHLPWQS